jgi:hypothetical protein
MTAEQQAGRFAEVRNALLRARQALPPSSADWACTDPTNPGSCDNLADFAELVEQVEYEVALYSLAGIARGCGAGPECWRWIDEAAGLMRFGPQEWARVRPDWASGPTSPGEQRDTVRTLPTPATP